MASCQTSRWAGSSPIVRLEVVENSSTSTATVSKLDWKVYYISDYPASASARTYTVKINGSVPSGGTGSYNINGVTGTNLMASGTVQVNKGTSTQSISFSVSFPFNLTWSKQYKGTLSASGSVTVSAKTSYTVTYNANGGSGAPGKQTKIYGTNLTLSTGKPTRTGYTFKGWATSASGSATYQPGGSYSANANITLYAVWQKSTFAITYNANGGTGAPSSQTKTYGVDKTLTASTPTRTDYKFIGWGITAFDTTAKYQPGGTYSTDADITLYAIWVYDYEKPRIINATINRAILQMAPIFGVEIPVPVADDAGKLGLVAFDWATDKPVTSITIAFKKISASSWDTQDSVDVVSLINDETIANNGHINDDKKSGSISSFLMSERADTDSDTGLPVAVLDSDSSYNVRITVADSGGQTAVTYYLNGLVYPIDFLDSDSGTGTAIGKAAELANTFEVGWPTKFTGGIQNEILSKTTDLNELKTPNTYVSMNMSAKTYTNIPSDVSSSGGTFVVEVLSAGAEGQIMQRLTTTFKTTSKTYVRFYYGKAWGDWVDYKSSQKTLWSGAWYPNAATISLTEKISEQDHGIVLYFSSFAVVDKTETPYDEDWHSFFIPKGWVAAHEGEYMNFILIKSLFKSIATKRIKINDSYLYGDNDNSKSGTANGITYNNASFVLRAVYGV